MQHTIDIDGDLIQTTLVWEIDLDGFFYSLLLHNDLDHVGFCRFCIVAEGIFHDAEVIIGAGDRSIGLAGGIPFPAARQVRRFHSCRWYSYTTHSEAFHHR